MNPESSDQSLRSLLDEAPLVHSAQREQETEERVDLVGRLRRTCEGRFALILGADGPGAFVVEGNATDVETVEVLAETGSPLTRVVRLTLPAASEVLMGRPISALAAAQAQAWLLRPHRGVYVREGARPFALLRPHFSEEEKQEDGESRPVLFLDDSDPFGDPFRGHLEPGHEKQLIGDPNPIHLGGTPQERPKEAWEDKQPIEDKLPWLDRSGLNDPFRTPPDWWHPPMAWPPPTEPLGPAKPPWLDPKQPWTDLLWPPGPWRPSWLGGPTAKSPSQDLQLWPPSPGGVGGVDPYPWRPKGPFDDLIEKLPPLGPDPAWIPEWMHKITFPTPLFDDPGQRTIGLDYSWPW